MRPTVGRIVHYTNLGDRDGKFPPEIQAALITKVAPKSPLHPETPEHTTDEERYYVSLHIFYEDGAFNMKTVPFTESDAGSESARGKWTWPARVI